jgi:YidC/Oxa1 family membrane protein insertase
MDTKRMIVGMLVAFALVLGWRAFVVQLSKHKGWELDPQPQQQVAATQPATVVAGAPATQALATATTAGATAPLPAPAALALVGGERASANLGSARHDDPVFAMGLEVDSRGASIAKATLNRYLRGALPAEKRVNTKDENSRFVFQLPFENYRSMATRAVRINGRVEVLENAEWKLESSSDREAIFAIELQEAGRPLLRIRKHIELFQRPADKQPAGAAGYELLIRHTLENLSSAPLRAALELNGPTAPPREMDRTNDVAAVVGRNKTANTTVSVIEMTSYPALSFTQAKPAQELITADTSKPFVWAGLTSSYFDALVLPASADGKDSDPFVVAARAQALNPQAPDGEHVPGLFFTTHEIALAPAASHSLDLRVYFGPKLRELLKGDYYSAFPRMYDHTLTISGGCTWCTFQFLVDWLVGLLNMFHFVLRDWGLAIIALVVLVRLVLHPITKKSTINMHKMSKLAPEMERLKKKYGDNKEELNRAMMQFYKEHGATPVLGCLPMFLQMPIWIALWSALQGTFELRQAPFLQVGGISLTWIHDLAKPDRLFHFPEHPINLLLFSVDAINLLPILMGFVFFLQQKYTPQAAAMTPEQEQQRKMMMWMTLLFPVMLYTGPSGLNLYILTSTTIGIIESKRIRDHIKEREAATADGRVVIDVETVDKNHPEPKKQGVLRGLITRAQEYAEQVRREQEKRKKK